MIDIPSISAVIAATGVIVGVAFTILQLRDLVKTRQTDLVMRLYSTFGSEEFQRALARTANIEFEDYNDYVKKYCPSPTGFSEKPEAIAIGTVNVFFEGIGALLYMKLIDVSLSARLLGIYAGYMWEKVKPIVEGWRKQFDVPESMQWFEYLYNEIQRREQRLQH